MWKFPRLINLVHFTETEWDVKCSVLGVMGHKESQADTLMGYKSSTCGEEPLPPLA